MKRLEYIDALRGWAIIGVVASHSHQMFGNLSQLVKIVASNGAMGVRLFFIISALTIFITVDKKKQDTKELTSNFFIKRFLRIAPMYYLAIIYYIISNWFFLQKIDYEGIFSNLFFVHGLFPKTINSFVPGGWSITVEMFFYCLIPLIIRKINNLNNAVSFFIITCILRYIGIYITKRLLGDDGINGEFLYLFFPNQLPVFAIGIILYYLIIKKESINISPVNLISLVILMIISLMFKYYNLLLQEHLLFAYTFAVLIIFMSKKKIVLLDNKLIRFIGKISFSVYIIHFIVLFWLQRFNLTTIYQGSSTINFFIYFLLTLILSSAISYLTYEFVEKPFQKLGKKLTSNQEKPIFEK